MMKKRDRFFENEDLDLEDIDEEEEMDRELVNDDFEEEDRPHPAVIAGVCVGLIALAAVICAILWSVTHREQGKEQPVYATETLEDTTELGEAMSEAQVDRSERGEAMSETQVDRSESGEAMPETQVDKSESGEVMSETGMNEPETAEKMPAETETADVELAESGAVQEGFVEEQEPISGNESMSFTEVADTVTAKDVTNLRSVPSTADSENVVAQLLNGETLSRTGVNDTTGWSRLDYNGQTVYAVSGYLTTDLTYKTPAAPSDPNRINTQDGRVIIFQACDDYVTPKEYVNLRIEPSTSQGETTAKCQISNGTVVHRTGHSPDSGWSRVEYNGEVLYVVSSMVKNTYETEQ